MSTGLKVMNRWGEMIPVEKQMLANHLWETRQTKTLWEVVTEIVNVFKRTQPKKYDSYIIDVQDIRARQKIHNGANGRRYRGVSKDKVNDAYLVMRVDFPIWIMNCIRKLYDTSELPLHGKYGKKFFRDFGRKFPEFNIHESF